MAVSASAGARRITGDMIIGKGAVLTLGWYHSLSIEASTRSFVLRQIHQMSTSRWPCRALSLNAVSIEESWWGVHGNAYRPVLWGRCLNHEGFVHMIWTVTFKRCWPAVYNVYSWPAQRWCFLLYHGGVHCSWIKLLRHDEGMLDYVSCMGRRMIL